MVNVGPPEMAAPLNRMLPLASLEMTAGEAVPLQLIVSVVPEKPAVHPASAEDAVAVSSMRGMLSAAAMKSPGRKEEMARRTRR